MGFGRVALHGLHFFHFLTDSTGRKNNAYFRKIIQRQAL